MQSQYVHGLRGSRQWCLRAPVCTPCRVRVVKHVLPVQRQHLRVAANAAAAASAPAVAAPGAKSRWQRALEWWDVGQTENEKKQQPQKLSDTLSMAWQLIASEKKLIAAAAFLMVSYPICSDLCTSRWCPRALRRAQLLDGMESFTSVEGSIHCQSEEQECLAEHALLMLLMLL